MDNSVQQTNSALPKWVLPYSIGVTLLHSVAVISWIVLAKANPDMPEAERLMLYNEFWIVPSMVGANWFSGILLLLSLSVVIIGGKLLDEGKMRLGIIILVLNLCFVLLSGTSLLQNPLL